MLEDLFMETNERYQISFAPEPGVMKQITVICFALRTQHTLKSSNKQSLNRFKRECDEKLRNFSLSSYNAMKIEMDSKHCL